MYWDEFVGVGVGFLHMPRIEFVDCNVVEVEIKTFLVTISGCRADRSLISITKNKFTLDENVGQTIREFIKRTATEIEEKFRDLAFWFFMLLKDSPEYLEIHARFSKPF